MKIKVGDIVKNAVLTSKLSKGDILKKMKKSYPWLNTVLEDEYMQAKYVEQFGNVLDIDFKKLIPELKKIVGPVTIEEQAETFDDMTNIQLRDKLIEIQSKYIALMEKYIKLSDTIEAKKH